MSSDVKRFYKDRAKTIKTDEKRFDYDEDGHMVERTKNEDGQYVVVKTIALPSYRPLTYEERDIMEQARQTAIAEATQVFETARRALYEASRASDRNEETIKRLNRVVQDADYVLHHTRFPLYGAIKERSIQIRKLDPSQTDQRLLPYPVLVAAAFPFSLQDYYVREGEAVAPLQSVAEIQQQQQQQQEQQEEPVLLFSTPNANENGYLSLEWAVDLEFQGTMYHSATQAVYAEMAKLLGDDAVLRKIMLTESPLMIHYEVKGSEAVWKENITRLLYEVNLHKFTRYPELQEMLRKTGTAVLGAYFPNDVLLGIGLSMDREESKQMRHWTGENLLGKALMEVRRVLLEQPKASMRPRVKAPDAPVPEPAAPARRVISRPKRVVNAIPAAPAAVASAVAPAVAPAVRRVVRRPAPSGSAPSGPVPSGPVPSGPAPSGSEGTL